MNAETAQLTLQFLGTLPRLAAVFIVLPLFGKKTLQGIIRNEFILILALFVYPSVTTPKDVVDVSPFFYLAVLAKEAVIGVSFGFLLGIFYWVAENVGYLIDLQTGTNNLQIYDPINEHEEGPTSGFLLHFVIVMTFAGGGLLTILSLLFESYRVWPVFDLGPRLDLAFADAMAARADTLFALTVRYAAPIITLLLMIEFGLGLINRFAPSMDVYSAAMPLKSIVAFFVLLVFMSFIVDSLQQFLGPDSDALKVLREALR
jgi:type III secretion protein T